jgi:hypothetical protein
VGATVGQTALLILKPELMFLATFFFTSIDSGTGDQRHRSSDENQDGSETSD